MEPELSIIVPVYNEVKSIEKVISDIRDKILTNFSGTAELVICEDGSQDGTKELLHRLQKENDFRLESGDERKGYNKAVKDALSLAKGKIIFMCDSGGAHEINDFFKLYEHINQYGIVSGHKKKRQDPFHRIVLSRIYNLYVSALFQHRFYDIDCGFKVYRREVLDRILPEVKTLKECVSTEILLRSYRQGFKIKEIPVIHYRRNLDEVKTFSLKKLPTIVSQLFIDLLRLKKVI